MPACGSMAAHKPGAQSTRMDTKSNAARAKAVKVCKPYCRTCTCGADQGVRPTGPAFSKTLSDIWALAYGGLQAASRERHQARKRRPEGRRRLKPTIKAN